MKPHRVAVTNKLVTEYGLYDKMKIYRAVKATDCDMEKFHCPNYIKCLKTLNTTCKASNKELRLFNIKDDCPPFDGLFEFCSIYTGASLTGANLLNQKACDVAINWAGGLHHAKKSKASGFCYINDIVLAILELLKFHSRVLYIDIDVHHGDGVQEAFYDTDRVMTLSFHQFGNSFFPGTGSVFEIGKDMGRHYCVNVPFKRGMDDKSYVGVFTPVVQTVMNFYQPSCIVLQCGADSLAGDKLGCFNLSIRGHGECIKIVKDLNVPLLVLGGGGYILRNVARCWTYETGILVDEDLNNHIPDNDYKDYFGPDFVLHPEIVKEETNSNSRAFLNRIVSHVIEDLRSLTPVPSVQMQAIHPNNLEISATELDPDVRVSAQERDAKVEPSNEFYDGRKKG